MSLRNVRRFWQYSLLGSLLLLLTLTLLYPIYLTVRGGLAEDVATGQGFTLDHLKLVFEDPLQVQALLNALKLALVTLSLIPL